MYITADLLRKYKGCEQGIKYIERFYPEGAEMIDIIQDRHINKEFLHWGREHLTHTPDELAAYIKACRIINTDGFWYSQDVRDSKYVVKSKDVESSIGVFESTDVKSSNDIINSESILDSKQVLYSSMIDESTKIFKGQNVTGSTNICNSTMIANSRNIIDSFSVFDSSEIINCSNVSDSYFCQDCNNIKHCMFCYGIEDAEYCIFNKPIEPKHYELIVKQYLKYLTEQLDFIRDWPEDLLVSVHVSPTRKFDDWFHPINSRFWKWVRTLPNFDSMLIYNITMLPELLVD